MGLTTLENEIVRYVSLQRGAGPRDIVEAMRNRWGSRFGDVYHDAINKVIAGLVKSRELELVGSVFKRRSFRAEPKGWISFAWTTEALLVGAKTVTRRAWKDSYAFRFSQGNIVTAYDKRPDFGGKAVALLRLSQTPYKERSDKIPLVDWINEGFEYLQTRGKKVNGRTPKDFWEEWQAKPETLWVIRFEIVELL